MFRDSPLIVFFVMCFGFLLIFVGVQRAVSAHVDLLRGHGEHDLARKVEGLGTLALLVILVSAVFFFEWLVKA